MAVLLSEPAYTGRSDDLTIKFVEEQLVDREFAPDEPKDT